MAYTCSKSSGHEKKKSKVSVGYWKRANGRKQDQVKVSLAKSGKYGSVYFQNYIREK